MSDNANLVESATSEQINTSLKPDYDGKAAALSITVFKPFNKFPKEIRDAIWELAACEPRVVEVDFVVKSSAGRSNPGAKVKYQIDHRLTSAALTPAILHTCRESRTMGTKFYERLPSHEFQDIYINWEKDIVVFDSIRSLFHKIPWVFSSSIGRTPADHPTCDWLCEMKEKCVRFGVHDRHAMDFVTKYDRREHFKSIKDITVLSKMWNEGCNGEVAAASMKDRVANVAPWWLWWETFQERLETEVPKHLKESIRYVHAVRKRGRLLRRERGETNSGESSAVIFAFEPIETIGMAGIAQTLDS